MNLLPLAIALLTLTLQNPRAAARQIIGWRLPLSAGVIAVLLVAVLSAILGYLAFQLSPGAADPDLQALFGNPVQTALVQVAVQSLTCGLIWAVGRKFGGQGSLSDTLVLKAWVDVPLILMQAVQLAVMGPVPALAEVLGLVGLALYTVLLTLFVSELHGFRSAAAVFFGILATTILTAVVVVGLAATFLGLEGLAHV